MKKLTADEVRIRSKDWRRFGQEFLGGSDRSAAVLGATWLDTRLRMLLESYLVDDPAIVSPLFAAFAPLSSFAARPRMAASLGLLSKAAFEDLEIIRTIRNAFAHEPPGVSFSDARIVAECKRLETPLARPRFARAPGADARKLFEITVTTLANAISRSTQQARKRRRRA